MQLIVQKFKATWTFVELHVLRLHNNYPLSQNVLLERACLGMVLNKNKKK